MLANTMCVCEYKGNTPMYALLGNYRAGKAQTMFKSPDKEEMLSVAAEYHKAKKRVGKIVIISGKIPE